VSIYAAVRALAGGDELVERLVERERRNSAVYGYGTNAFLLSLVETLLEQAVAPSVICDVVEQVRVTIYAAGSNPVLLDEVPEVLDQLQGHRLLLVTRGDLAEQRRKVDSSGLAGRFDQVEILPDKEPRTYSRMLAKHGIEPSNFAMVGNSLVADILPAIEIGASAVLVPRPLGWAVEASSTTFEHPRFRTISKIAELPGALSELQRQA